MNKLQASKLATQLKDPVVFIEHCLLFHDKKFKLYPFQKDIVRNIDILHDKVCLRKARQVGGTLLVAALIVQSSCITKNATFLVVSKTKEQSTFCYAYAMNFFKESPLLKPMVDEQSSVKDNLVLKNGTRILARTCGSNSAENLRGITLSGNGALVIDESAFVSSDSTQTLLHICHGAGLLHCSTPRRPIGSFYDACKDPAYKVFHVPAFLSPRITREAIEQLRKSLRPSQFKTDVLAEFSAGENSVIDSDAIDRSINEQTPLFDADSFNFDDGFPFLPKPNTNYVYSLDTASSSSIDQWILTIGDYSRTTNSLDVVAYCAWQGSRSKHENAIKTDNPEHIIRDINLFRKRFPCFRLFVDSTTNEFFADHLLNNYLWPVEKIVWSTNKKQLLYEHLSTCFSANKITIPNDTNITSQLLDLTYDLKKMQDDSDKKIYLAGQDDYPASLSMLAQICSTEGNNQIHDYIEAI